MTRWLHCLGAWTRPKPEDVRLARAIERAIYLVEPRLKQASGYPKRYRAVIAQALAHVDRLAASLPGARVVNPESYVRDPFVHALFGSAPAIGQCLGLSRALREYLAAPGTDPSREFHALMDMRRAEKNGFGMDTEGDVIRRDVARRTVSFSDHTLSCVAADEAGVRERLAWSLFDSLIGHVASHLDGLRQAKADLEQRRDEALGRLRGLPADRQAGARLELDRLLGELRQATQALDLARILGYFENVLRAPETLLRLETRALRLDAMGIVRAEHESTISHVMEFVDLIGHDRRRLTVLLVRAQPVASTSLAERLSEADRWLAT